MNYKVFIILILTFYTINANDKVKIDDININSNIQIDKKIMKKLDIKKKSYWDKKDIEKLKNKIKKTYKLKDVNVNIIKNNQKNILNISINMNEKILIYKIEITSPDKINKSFWQDFIGLKDNSFITKNQIEILKNRIEKTNLFKNISYKIIKRKEKNVLIFYLNKIEIVKSITIDNNFPILEQEIRRKIPYRIGSSFSKDRIPSIIRNINKLYESDGYFNTKLNIYTKINKDKLVDINVNIKNKGVQLNIKDIFIIDKGKINPEIIKKVKTYMQANKFDNITGYFTEEGFEKNMSSAIKYLHKIGYLTARLKLYRLPEKNVIISSDLNDTQINKKIILKYKNQLKSNKFIKITKRGFVYKYDKKECDAWLSLRLGPKVDINFEGMTVLSDKKAKELLTLYGSSSISNAQVEKSVKKIKQYYQSLGYYFIETDYEIKRNKKNIKINFKIQENKKLYIRKISFKGVNTKEFSSDDLNSLLGTGSYNYLGSTGYLQEQLFLKDLKKVLDYYKSYGYLDVKIGKIAFNFFNNKKFLEIYIHIDEGIQTKFKKPKIYGIKGNRKNRKEKLNEMQKYLKESKSDGFDVNWFLSNAKLIKEYYLSNGYPFAQVTAYVTKNNNAKIKLYPLDKDKNINDIVEKLKNSKTLSLLYMVEENKEKKIGSVFIRGNLQTTDDTILNEISFKKGETFKFKKINETKDNLRFLNVFKGITVSHPLLNEQAISDSEDSLVDIIISFEELKHRFIDFSIGTSSNEILSTSIKFTNLNLFGWAKKLSFLLRAGEIYKIGELNFNSPKIFSFKIGSNLKLFAKSENLPAFDLFSSGIALSFYRTFFKKLSLALSFELKYAKTSLNILDDISQIDMFQGTERTVSFSVIPTIYFENRDNIFDPKNGFMFKISGDWERAAPWIVVLLPKDIKPNISNFEFYKIQLQLTSYLTPVKFLTLASSIRLGWSAPRDNSIKKIPKKDRFFLGGDSSIRGYELNMFGEIENDKPLGDNTMFLINMELRFYLHYLVKNLSLALFSDLGGLAVDMSSFFKKETWLNHNKIDLAIGLGFRYMTIIGPIRLDFAYLPLNSPEKIAFRWFHFSFNYPF